MFDFLLTVIPETPYKIYMGEDKHESKWIIL